MRQLTQQNLQSTSRVRKPAYMVPPMIMQIDKVPLTVNQKVDNSGIQGLGYESLDTGFTSQILSSGVFLAGNMCRIHQAVSPMRSLTAKTMRPQKFFRQLVSALGTLSGMYPM